MEGQSLVVCILRGQPGAVVAAPPHGDSVNISYITGDFEAVVLAPGDVRGGIGDGYYRSVVVKSDSGIYRCLQHGRMDRSKLDEEVVTDILSIIAGYHVEVIRNEEGYGVVDDLRSHFDGTCSRIIRLQGNVVDQIDHGNGTGYIIGYSGFEGKGLDAFKGELTIERMQRIVDEELSIQTDVSHSSNRIVGAIDGSGRNESFIVKTLYIGHGHVVRDQRCRILDGYRSSIHCSTGVSYEVCSCHAYMEYAGFLSVVIPVSSCHTTYEEHINGLNDVVEIVFDGKAGFFGINPDRIDGSGDGKHVISGCDVIKDLIANDHRHIRHRCLIVNHVDYHDAVCYSSGALAEGGSAKQELTAGIAIVNCIHQILVMRSVEVPHCGIRREVINGAIGGVIGKISSSVDIDCSVINAISIHVFVEEELYSLNLSIRIVREGCDLEVIDRTISFKHVDSAQMLRNDFHL